jgi:hypothetical protein
VNGEINQGKGNFMDEPGQKTVVELMGYDFLIPDYQRGYR